MTISIATAIFSVILLSVDGITTVLGADEVCTKTDDRLTFGVCQQKYAAVCCNKVYLDNGTYLSNQFTACSDLREKACVGGFYDTGNGTAARCPEGYFCFEQNRCMVPCPSGSYCPGFSNVDNTTICKHSLTGEKLSAVLLNGQLKCPGEYRLVSYCPEGYYCPTPTEMYTCPDGKYCPAETSLPRRCNLFGPCNFGISIDDIVGLLLIALLILVFIVVMTFRYSMQNRSILFRQEKTSFAKDDGKKHFNASFNLSNALWYSCKVDITGYNIIIINFCYASFCFASCAKPSFADIIILNEKLLITIICFQISKNFDLEKISQ